ncbi:hypothetical protein GS634_07795 [Ruegeria atlantica]|uniref:Uncharacterized protein n=1 Tax=Ruegeria atlantica TaxID=81569 RepID=A0AA91BZM6_9RHOB|nr:hypothetical protein [Ruegeria atlantica]NOE18026.1 hypothetical protein [Ruegeria atlantica]
MTKPFQLITGAKSKNPFKPVQQDEVSATKGELRRSIERTGEMVRKVVAPLTRRMTELEEQQQERSFEINELRDEIASLRDDNAALRDELKSLQPSFMKEGNDA